MRLKALRRMAGLTQAELAERADISLEHVSKIERGGGAPSFHTIVALARALETEPANLFLFAEMGPAGLPGNGGDAATSERDHVAPYIPHMGTWSLSLVDSSYSFSANMLAMHGYSPKEKLPTFMAFLERHIHPADLPRVHEALAMLKEGKHITRLELRFFRKDAEMRHGLIDSEVEYDRDGAPVSTFGVLMDVTELKRLRGLLQQSRMDMEDRALKRTEELEAVALELNGERRQREQLQESMAVFEKVIAQSKDYQSFVDRDYVYRAVSGTYLNYGYVDTNEVVGKTMAEVLGEDVFKDVVKAPLDECFQGKDVQYTTWMDLPGLGKRYMDVSYYPYGEHGEVLGAVVSVRDITEQYHAQERIRLSEEKYRLLADSMADVVWTLDDKYAPTYVSPSITPLTGMTPEEFLKGGWVASMSPSSQDMVTEVLSSRELEQDFGEKRYELEITHKDGNVVWLESLLRPLTDRDGGFAGVQGVSRDVTQRKQAEDEL
ncbi:MAG: PAS domain S-box protein, partial [Desulfovibrio sp.]